VAPARQAHVVDVVAHVDEERRAREVGRGGPDDRAVHEVRLQDVGSPRAQVAGKTDGGGRPLGASRAVQPKISARWSALYPRRRRVAAERSTLKFVTGRDDTLRDVTEIRALERRCRKMTHPHAG